MCNNVTELRKAVTSSEPYAGIVVPYSKVMLQALPMWASYAMIGADSLNDGTFFRSRNLGLNKNRTSVYRDTLCNVRT